MEEAEAVAGRLVAASRRDMSRAGATADHVTESGSLCSLYDLLVAVFFSMQWPVLFLFIDNLVGSRGLLLCDLITEV